MKDLKENREYHVRYWKAVNNKVRITILKFLLDGGKEYDEIREEIKIQDAILKYHLEVLEAGYCIEKEGETYTATQEGTVAEYL